MPEPEASKAATVKEGWTAGGRGQGQPAWTDEDGQEAPPRRPVEDGSLIVELSGPLTGRRRCRGWGQGRLTAAPRWPASQHRSVGDVGDQGSPHPPFEHKKQYYLLAPSLLPSKSCLKCLLWPMLTRNYEEKEF